MQLQLKDFISYKFLSNVKASKDAKHVVFKVTTCDEENNTYNNNLYMYDGENVTPLTNSNKEGNFIYLDEETILFTSTRLTSDEEKVKNGEENTSFYKISLKGGEAVKCFSVPLFVSSFAKIKEDRYLLYASYDLDFSYALSKEDKDKKIKAKKEETDYEVFTRIPFCHNGGGFATNSINRLFVYDAKEDLLEVISDENITINSYRLNENCDEILVVANKYAKKPSHLNSIMKYNLNTRCWEIVLCEKEYGVEDAFYFNNGILFLGNKELKHGLNENARFFFIDENNTISLLNNNEDSLWNSVGSDCRYGGGSSMKVVGDTFYFTSTIEKDNILRKLDKEGNISDVILLDGSVDCFDIQNNKIFYIGLKDGKLQELYDEEKQLSALNEEVLKDKYVASYNEVKFENDGISFTGWVLLPKDYDPNKKYPAILDIHGGPKTVYGTVFYHEMQVWANMGYFVFFTNPRGSDGRGNEFMDIFGKYGTIDYDDLMKFTDTVLETYPAIDKNRIGVTGGSYGGFMTNWIIGHTDRFACAATQRSISNWISFYGTSDIGMFFASDQIHGNIFETPEKLWEHSPLKYASNMVTPTLIIHADEDFRCPIEQGYQLYTALVDREIDTRFVLFHGENHELSRSGKVKHRVRRLSEITDWMEKYLKEA